MAKPGLNNSRSVAAGLCVVVLLCGRATPVFSQDPHRINTFTADRGGSFGDADGGLDRQTSRPPRIGEGGGGPAWIDPASRATDGWLDPGPLARFEPGGTAGLGIGGRLGVWESLSNGALWRADEWQQWPAEPEWLRSDAAWSLPGEGAGASSAMARGPVAGTLTRGGTGAIPEPGMLALFVVGTMLALRRHR